MIEPKTLENLILQMQQKQLDEFKLKQKEKYLYLKLRKTFQTPSQNKDYSTTTTIDKRAEIPKSLQKIDSDTIFAPYVGVMIFEDKILKQKTDISLKKGEKIGEIHAGSFKREVVSPLDGTFKIQIDKNKTKVEFGTLLLSLQ